MTATEARRRGFAFVERATRREGDVEKPLGPKATRTRGVILEAANAAFSAAGYQGTTVADIAAEAGVSLGTVYQYFRDRSDIVRALVARNVGTMLERDDPVWRAAEGTDGLHRVLLSFVESYAAVAPMAALWEEVTHCEDELAEVRRTLGRAFTAAVEREIRGAAGAGLLRDEVDPALAAVMLTGMVDRSCYVLYCFDPPAVRPVPHDVATALTALWAGAIGLAR